MLPINTIADLCQVSKHSQFFPSQDPHYEHEDDHLRFMHETEFEREFCEQEGVEHV